MSDDQDDDEGMTDLEKALRRICDRATAGEIPTAAEVDPMAEVRGRLARARVPKLHVEAVLDAATLNPSTPSMLAVRAFRKDKPGSWCVLSGGTGCGKSTAAAWLLGQTGGLWCFATEVGSAHREREEWRRMLTCQVLVLDDLGAEYRDDKGWFTSVLDELLIRRHDEGLVTLVTTNLPRGAFMDRYAGRISDRLRDGFAEVKGGSLR